MRQNNERGIENGIWDVLYKGSIDKKKKKKMSTCNNSFLCVYNKKCLEQKPKVPLSEGC